MVDEFFEFVEIEQEKQAFLWLENSRDMWCIGRKSFENKEL